MNYVELYLVLAGFRGALRNDKAEIQGDLILEVMDIIWEAMTDQQRDQINAMNLYDKRTR